MSRICSRYRDICFSCVYRCTGNAHWALLNMSVFMTAFDCKYVFYINFSWFFFKHGGRIRNFFFVSFHLKEGLWKVCIQPIAGVVHFMVPWCIQLCNCHKYGCIKFKHWWTRLLGSSICREGNFSLIVWLQFGDLEK